MTPPELLPRYYLDNFRYVLLVVQRLYGRLLTDAETDFLTRFDQLSDDAQCLFVRMSNRRGRFFRPQKFNYPEINDLPTALHVLIDHDFAESLSTSHQSEADAVLSLFTKSELLQKLPLATEEIRLLNKAKKVEVVQYLWQQIAFDQLVMAFTATESIVGVRFEAEVLLMKYLFFGNRWADMTEFVVRDLGMVKIETYDESKLTARFQTRQEVNDKLLLSLTTETFYELSQADTPAEMVYDWFMIWNEARHGPMRSQLTAIAQPDYDRLVCKVGAWLERAKLADQALSVYRLTDQAPARERRARLLFRNGLTDEALALCEEIEHSPQDADERYFAQDFRQKIADVGQKKRSRKATTQFLAGAETIGISATFRHHVEAGVMEYYAERGYQTAFAENHPWRALFGLVFWNVIYNADSQAIHNPLQRGPSDFYSPDFFARREAQLRAQLDKLVTTADWQAHVSQVAMAKNGIDNVLVDWSDALLPLVQQLIALLTMEQLEQMLWAMAQHLRTHLRGFPDLLIWQTDGSYAFVEVKSPTDQLSAQQLHWLAFFQTIGVSARVVRVVWTG